MRLTILEARNVVHRNVLNGGKRAGPAKLDLAHVTHIKQPDAGAHRHMLGDQAATGTGIFNRHVPSAEVDHLGFKCAMGGVEGGLFQGRGDGYGGGGHDVVGPFAGQIYPSNDRHMPGAGQTPGFTA